MTPIIGENREQTLGECISELKWFLRTALTNYESWDRTNMTQNDDYDLTGLKLRDRFVSYLEVLVAYDKLPYNQRRYLWQNLAEGLSQESIAFCNNCSQKTVSRYINEGLTTMVEAIWGN